MIVKFIEIAYQVIQGWNGGGAITKGVDSYKESQFCSLINLSIDKLYTMSKGHWQVLSIKNKDPK